MNLSFEKTRLWQRTLAKKDNDLDERARDRLRNSFFDTRDKVAPLVAEIGKQLPQLTVHDITHLDALWEVADLLIGPDYPISPTEAYVLGMSFLFHDAATSTVAFQNGIEDVRSTIEWKDYVAQQGWAESDVVVGATKYQMALFEVLRLLHPKQAEQLLTHIWKTRTGDDLFLLSDIQLRNHYGHDVGRIAHSHWWDIAQVEEKWGNAQALTLHSSLSVQDSNQWKVDRFKVALILRCTDAAHIDSRRAPDMLAALTRPSGVSAAHWDFQNRLGLPSVSNQNELYWSAGKPFSASDADAWWLCYDAAQMINRELRATNRLLKSNGRRTLCVDGVAGASYLPEFLKTVPVEGWYPVDVNFKVSKVGDVIEKFGGAALYGDEPWRAMRELIQNAADAVRARRAKRSIEGGKIIISVQEAGDATWLHVTDDGIGMSEYVMSEVLLDFGRSLWSDNALRREIPGLAATGFKSMGKFGIGFLSVFMLGDEVEVTSWRDGDAEVKQATLKIFNRTQSRPVLLRTNTPNRLNEYGTRVSVKLHSSVDGLYPKKFNQYFYDKKDAAWNLPTLVAAIAPTLDIDLLVKFSNISELAVKANDWAHMTSLQLLNRIAPMRHIYESTAYLWNVCEADSCLMGRLGHNGDSAFTSSGKFGYQLGILTHAGIISGTIQNLSGVLISQNNSDLARNQSQPACTQQAISTWVQATRHHDLENEWTHRPATRHLLSLGLSVNDIKYGENDDFWKSPQTMRDWVNDAGHSEILLAIEMVEVPSDISQDDFSRDFDRRDNVIDLSNIGFESRRYDFGLKNWVEDLFPIESSFPRSLTEAVIYKIGDAFPSANFDELECVVGYVDGTREITALCIRVSNLE